MVRLVCLEFSQRGALSTSKHAVNADGYCFGHETELMRGDDMMLL